MLCVFVIVYMHLSGIVGTHCVFVCVCACAVVSALLFFLLFFNSVIVCFLSTSCPNTLNTTTDGCVSSER